MTLQTKRILTSVFFSLAVVSAVAIANNVTLPNTFAAGTPARAAEVNANFIAVKTAVDDSQSQITALDTRVTALQTRACPTGTTAIGGSCIENTQRAALSWGAAAQVCMTAGGDLCGLNTVRRYCQTTPGFPVGSEWSDEAMGFNAAAEVQVVVAFKTSGGVCLADGPSTESFVYPYRCCYRR